VWAFGRISQIKVNSFVYLINFDVLVIGDAFWRTWMALAAAVGKQNAVNVYIKRNNYFLD